MQDSLYSFDEEYWVIWNGSLGVVDTVTIGEVEEGTAGRNAWLEEPYDMVGPFDFDELLNKGRIAFAACFVMSRERWQADQIELRQEAYRIRREAQERAFEEQFRYQQQQRRQANRENHRFNEKRHRQVLDLPMEGVLEQKQIKTAFKRLAQKAHPDAGGSHELFVQITEARDALLQYFS